MQLKELKERFTTGRMIKGIPNIQIENTIKTRNGEDLSNNFVGVFPSNKMTKLIDYKQLINKKLAKRNF